MRFARNTLLILAGISSTGWTRAEEPGAAIPPELILERFAVNKGGDALLVPVKVAGKDRMFLVDTGATHTFIDAPLAAGEPLQVVTASTPQGTVGLNVYGAPDASVGRLPLRVDTVVGMDLKLFREVSGHPIEGILGMDFLARHVVHIDFDKGELLLLRSAPKDAGDELTIVINRRNLPEVEAQVSREQKVYFLIDTGSISRDTGGMEFLPMRWSGEYQEIGSSLSETASGTHANLLFRGRQMRLGGFSVERPIFHETPYMTKLGNGFCSRFVVTFDFPGRKLYLRKGRGYERPDLRDLSGLHLVRRDRAVVIDIVDKESPGSRAGVVAGDVLLTLGDRPSSQASLFEIRTALSKDGPVACTIRHNSEDRKLTLALPR